MRKSPCVTSAQNSTVGSSTTAGSPPLSLINLRLAGSRNWWRNSKRKKPSYTQSNRSKAGLSWWPLSYQGQGCDVPHGQSASGHDGRHQQPPRRAENAVVILSRRAVEVRPPSPARPSRRWSSPPPLCGSSPSRYLRFRLPRNKDGKNVPNATTAFKTVALNNYKRPGSGPA